MDHLTGTVTGVYHRIVVAYDIPDDARRERVADVLADRLDRVQRSVFDGWARQGQVARVWQAAKAEMRPASDEAIALQLCRACAAASIVAGCGRHPATPATSWIV